MNDLTTEAKRLLALLVQQLEIIEVGRPETYISYSDVHRVLRLEKLGDTYGRSLERQGLVSLADWTKEAGRPGITGLIVDKGTARPGDGYFKLFNRENTDFAWWTSEILRSKLYDWSADLESQNSSERTRSSGTTQTERTQVVVDRVVRDTALAVRVRLYTGDCANYAVT